MLKIFTKLSINIVCVFFILFGSIRDVFSYDLGKIKELKSYRDEFDDFQIDEDENDTDEGLNDEDNVDTIKDALNGLKKTYRNLKNKMDEVNKIVKKSGVGDKLEKIKIDTLENKNALWSGSNDEEKVMENVTLKKAMEKAYDQYIAARKEAQRGYDKGHEWQSNYFEDIPVLGRIAPGWTDRDKRVHGRKAMILFSKSVANLDKIKARLENLEKDIKKAKSKKNVEVAKKESLKYGEKGDKVLGPLLTRKLTYYSTKDFKKNKAEIPYEKEINKIKLQFQKEFASRASEIDLKDKTARKKIENDLLEKASDKIDFLKKTHDDELRRIKRDGRRGDIKTNLKKIITKSKSSTLRNLFGRDGKEFLENLNDDYDKSKRREDANYKTFKTRFFESELDISAGQDDYDKFLRKYNTGDLDSVKVRKKLEEKLAGIKKSLLQNLESKKQDFDNLLQKYNDDLAALKKAPKTKKINDAIIEVKKKINELEGSSGPIKEIEQQLSIIRPLVPDLTKKFDDKTDGFGHLLTSLDNVKNKMFGDGKTETNFIDKSFFGKYKKAEKEYDKLQDDYGSQIGGTGVQATANTQYASVLDKLDEIECWKNRLEASAFASASSDDQGPLTAYNQIKKIYEEDKNDKMENLRKDLREAKLEFDERRDDDIKYEKKLDKIEERAKRIEKLIKKNRASIEKSSDFRNPYTNLKQHFSNLLTNVAPVFFITRDFKKNTASFNFKSPGGGSNENKVAVCKKQADAIKRAYEYLRDQTYKPFLSQYSNNSQLNRSPIFKGHILTMRNAVANIDNLLGQGASLEQATQKKATTRGFTSLFFAYTSDTDVKEYCAGIERESASLEVNLLQLMGMINPNQVKKATSEVVSKNYGFASNFLPRCQSTPGKQRQGSIAYGLGLRINKTSKATRTGLTQAELDREISNICDGQTKSIESYNDLMKLIMANAPAGNQLYDNVLDVVRQVKENSVLDAAHTAARNLRGLSESEITNPSPYESTFDEFNRYLVGPTVEELEVLNNRLSKSGLSPAERKAVTARIKKVSEQLEKYLEPFMAAGSNPGSSRDYLMQKLLRKNPNLASLINKARQAGFYTKNHLFRSGKPNFTRAESKANRSKRNFDSRVKSARQQIAERQVLEDKLDEIRDTGTRRYERQAKRDMGRIKKSIDKSKRKYARAYEKAQFTCATRGPGSRACKNAKKLAKRQKSKTLKLTRKLGRRYKNAQELLEESESIRAGLKDRDDDEDFDTDDGDDDFFDSDTDDLDFGVDNMRGVGTGRAGAFPPTYQGPGQQGYRPPMPPGYGGFQNQSYFYQNYGGYQPPNPYTPQNPFLLPQQQQQYQFQFQQTNSPYQSNPFGYSNQQYQYQQQGLTPQYQFGIRGGATGLQPSPYAIPQQQQPRPQVNPFSTVPPGQQGPYQPSPFSLK